MLQRIDARLVHKIVERNVLLARVERRAGDADTYDAEMVMDLEHPFFFEHPLDHVPAMMLVEAGRQLGIAISHLFLGVPMGVQFATRSFDIRFTDFADLDHAVLIEGRVSDRRYRKGELVELRLDGGFVQRGRPLGTMGGEWLMLRPEVWRRYRSLERARTSAP